MITAMVIAAVVGMSLTSWIQPSARGSLFAGESILFGIAAPGLVLLLLSLLGIPWSAASLLGGCVTVALACLAVVWRRGVRGERDGEIGSGTARSALSVAIDLVSLCLVAGYSRFAWVSAGAENDFIGIWGVKAWSFLEKGGIDWGFLQAAGNWPAHPDYPLLLPAMFSWIALVAGGWSEQLAGLVHPVLGLGVLLVVRHELGREDAAPSVAALGTLALVPVAVSPWIGLGEGPMVAFGTAGLLLLRGWFQGSKGGDAAGAVFLGLAASTKNEGITLLLCAAACVALFARGRRVRATLALWPAVAIALPWVAVRTILGLQNDLTAGAVHVRLLDRLGSPDALAALARLLVATPVAMPWLWLAAIATIAGGWKMLRAADGFVIAVVALQACFFLSAYLVTPNSIEWQVAWSWERLVSQLALPVATIAVCVVQRAFAQRNPEA